jgi:hypothetical protein
MPDGEWDSFEKFEEFHFPKLQLVATEGKP